MHDEMAEATNLFLLLAGGVYFHAVLFFFPLRDTEMLAGRPLTAFFLSPFPWEYEFPRQFFSFLAPGLLCGMFLSFDSSPSLIFDAGMPRTGALTAA